MIGGQIRTVEEQDVAAVAAFQTSCWQQVYRGVVPDCFLDSMDLEARTAAWHERVVSGRRRVLAAWDGGVVIGVVSWTVDVSPQQVDELSTLYVAVPRHGTGLSGELVNRALGTRAARLWVFEANHRARNFYAKHRFFATGAALSKLIPEQVSGNSSSPVLRPSIRCRGSEIMPSSASFSADEARWVCAADGSFSGQQSTATRTTSSGSMTASIAVRRWSL